MKSLCSFVFLCFIATAQLPLPGFTSGIPVSDQLKLYMKLTTDQVRQIETVNKEFQTWLQSRLQRQIQVQVEITAETAKSPLDPLALGVRYAEVESIRREITDERARVQAKATALLNETQTALVKTLDQAMRLQAEISDAQCQNLLGPAPATLLTRSGDFNTGTSSSSNTIGGVLGSTCGVYAIIVQPAGASNISRR